MLLLFYKRHVLDRNKQEGKLSRKCVAIRYGVLYSIKMTNVVLIHSFNAVLTRLCDSSMRHIPSSVTDQSRTVISRQVTVEQRQK